MTLRSKNRTLGVRIHRTNLSGLLFLGAHAYEYSSNSVLRLAHLYLAYPPCASLGSRETYISHRVHVIAIMDELSNLENLELLCQQVIRQRQQ